MMTVGGCGAVGQAVPAAAEQLDQLVVHDLDDLLARRERLEHVLPDGLLADAVDEALDDLEVDVGLEQRHAHLAQRLLDVVLGQPAAAAEPVEDGLQSRAQGVEHWKDEVYATTRKISTRRRMRRRYARGGRRQRRGRTRTRTGSQRRICSTNPKGRRNVAMATQKSRLRQHVFHSNPVNPSGFKIRMRGLLPPLD